MITVKNLHHKIGNATILNNINLTIPNGGITALIGQMVRANPPCSL